MLDGLPAAGGAVVADAGVTHEMTWPSVDEFWEGMTRAGPWYSRRLQQGDGAMDAARAAFGAPGGGFEDGGAPVRHAPRARLLVAATGGGRRPGGGAVRKREHGEVQQAGGDDACKELAGRACLAAVPGDLCLSQLLDRLFMGTGARWPASRPPPVTGQHPRFQRGC